MKPRKTAAIPKSLPRDLLLHAIAKHEPALQASLVGARCSYVRSRDVVVATFEFDPHAYLAAAEAAPRKRGAARPEPAAEQLEL